MLKPLRLMWTVLLLVPGLALAADPVTAPDIYTGQQHIVAFNSRMQVEANGTADITETLLYDTGPEAHHGIYRTIPVEQQDAQGNHYYYAFNFGSATADGQSVQVNQTKQNGTVLLRLGDPSVTFTGQKTYVISYSLAPVPLRAGDHDRVIWNVTGNAWDIPIASVSQTVTLPAAPLSQVCYQGTTGSTNQDDCFIGAEGQTLTVSGVSLDPGSGLTWDANLPSGSFNTYLVANKKPPLTATEKLMMGVLIFGAVLLLVALVVGVVGRVGDYRRRHSRAVYPLYEAPDGLTPAQVGLLTDRRVSNVEVTATLLDLAVRGYIKIIEMPGASVFGIKFGRSYRLERLKDGSDLTGYDRAVFDAVLQGLPAMDLDDLRNSSMSVARELQQARKELGRELTEKGYYKMSPTGGWSSFGPHLWGIGIAVIYITADVHLSVTWLAWVVPVLGAVALAAEIRRSSLTQQGGEEWAKVEGFKWFLKMTEADRLKFTDAPGKTPEQFSHFLPYAVALGVEDEWAKQFEGIDVTPAVNGWYAGSTIGAFNAATVADSIGGAFASSVGSSFAGSGGGGGAGGGGGGGGGGGW